MSEPARQVPVFRSIAEVPPGFGPTVAAIGNFDGVHCGHQEILSAVVQDAQAREARSLAITFDPHPDRFLRPARTQLLLTSLDQRIRLLAETGVDAVLVLPFEERLACLTPEQFVRDDSRGRAAGFAHCTREAIFALVIARRRGWKNCALLEPLSGSACRCMNLFMCMDWRSPARPFEH